MLRRVLATIERYGMLPAGARVGVAVSGGADSVCLLHLLRELAPELGVALAVLHLEHGLRGEESIADANFVGELARRLDLPFHMEHADVASVADNLEQAARDARRQFFRRAIADGRVDRVATGHTRNDQAETVLFRFLRGSGTAGLAGVRPVTADGIVRPLLGVYRQEAEQWLRDRGISWREDSTNATMRFARNRIRQELLPALQREWNPALVDTLAQMADWAQAEEEYWRTQVDQVWTMLFGPVPVRRGEALVLPVGPFEHLPDAVARRVIRHAIELVKGDLRGIEFAHVVTILTLARCQAGSGRFQAAGVDAFRSFDWLRIGMVDSGRAERNFRLPLAVPGLTELPSRESAIRAEIIEEFAPNQTDDYVYNSDVGFVDWRRVSGPLSVRNWRPGDRYQPVGHSGEHKIKELFHDAQVPLWERRDWPVITAGENILWARRFGPAASAAAQAGSGAVLKIKEEKLESGRAELRLSR